MAAAAARARRGLVGRHGGYRLTDEMDLALSQQCLVEDDPTYLVVSGDVGGGQNSSHSGHPRCDRGVKAGDPAVRDRRGQNREVQTPRWVGKIADKERLAAGVWADLVVAHAEVPAKCTASKWKST